MSDPSIGRFVWHDLMTQDPDRAREFYLELLDWRIEDKPIASMIYRMIHVGETGIGGIEPLESTALPSHWMAYIGVDDVDASVRRVEEIGGKVHKPASDIETVGRFAVVSDPQGAMFAPFKSRHPIVPTRRRDLKGGMVCWNELTTTDDEAACRFYGAIFGWTANATDMGGPSTYWIQKSGTVETCGIMSSLKPDAPPYWCPYFYVDSVDEVTQNGSDYGATTIALPTDLPSGIGRFSLLQDPTGAFFGLFQRAAQD